MSIFKKSLAAALCILMVLCITACDSSGVKTAKESIAGISEFVTELTDVTEKISDFDSRRSELTDTEQAEYRQLVQREGMLDVFLEHSVEAFKELYGKLPEEDCQKIENYVLENCDISIYELLFD